jgi:phosphate transport system substrate-binding protein
MRDLEKLYHTVGIAHHLLALLVFLAEAGWAVFRGLRPPPSWWIILFAALAIGILTAKLIGSDRLGRWASPWLRILMPVGLVGVVAVLFVSCFIQLIPKPYVLRLHGSTVIGATCGIELARAYLEQKKHATNVEVNGPVVSGTLWNGGPASIEIQASSTWAGFEDLAAKECDIAMASQRIPADLQSMAEVDRDDRLKTRAVKELGDLRSPETEFVIGLDGVAVIVNSAYANTVGSMEKLRLHYIFQGTDDSYSVFVPDENSETRTAFLDFVYGSGDSVGDKHKSDPLTAPNIRSFRTDHELSDHVARKLNGIGIVPVHYVLPLHDGSQTAIGIIAAGHEPRRPTESSIRLEEYPFTQRLYLYTARDKSREEDVKGFIDFSLSAYGQALMEKNGVIVPKVTWESVQNSVDAPNDYKALATGNAARFSLAFRFVDGNQLESKADKDLLRFKDFLESPAGTTKEQILVAGFAGDQSSETTQELTKKNCRISLDSANAVAQWLQEHGLTPARTVGFGDRFPITRETVKEGLARNKRVEIWRSPSSYTGPWTCPDDRVASVDSLRQPPEKTKAQ